MTLKELIWQALNACDGHLITLDSEVQMADGRPVTLVAGVGNRLVISDPTPEELIMASRCDHKFIDGRSCLKCGWTPPV